MQNLQFLAIYFALNEIYFGSHYKLGIILVLNINHQVDFQSELKPEYDILLFNIVWGSHNFMR